MKEPKSDVNRKQADDPCTPCAIQQVGNPIHQVAAVDHRFSECCKCPGQRQHDEKKLHVSGQCVELMEVRWLVEEADKQWLTDEEFDSFQKEPSPNADCQRETPIAVARQPDAAPADFPHPKRDPCQ